MRVDPTATHHPFGVWDYCTGAFAVKPGAYRLFLGTSCEDTPFEAVVTVG